MRGRMLGKTLIVGVLLMLSASVMICVRQRQQARSEMEAVSLQFVQAVSRLDLLSLRQCLTEADRANMPEYYAQVAARMLAKLNENVRVRVQTRVVGVDFGAGGSTVYVKRTMTEDGTRLAKPVKTRISDKCTVHCIYDGAHWKVDLDRTLESGHLPAAQIALFKEYLRR